MCRVAVAIADPSLRQDLVSFVLAVGYTAEQLVPTADLTPGVDILFVDARCPDDLSAIARLRRDHPALRIVAIGHDTGHRAAIETRRHGADDFVRMPFDVTTLERALTAGTPERGPGGKSTHFLTRDPVVARLLDRSVRAADSDATIVIRGESGTGKSTLASWIHQCSRRRLGPLVIVNCAGLSRIAAEAELFGRTTGGGRMGAARGGTLVLDDVSDLAPELQLRLLHALQEPTLEAPEGVSLETSDIRIVATARHDLSDDVSAGKLGEALRLRLSVIELEIPPLRERPLDIDLLADLMACHSARELGCPAPLLDEAVLAVLRVQPLRGNLWELKSLMQRATLLFSDRPIDPAVLLSSRPPETAVVGMPPTLNLKQLEREAIAQSLIRTGGNRTRASRDLGISIRTLRNKIHQYGLT